MEEIMRPQSSFILTIIALVLGFFSAIAWFMLGTFFLSAFIAGFMEGISGEVVGLGSSNIVPAFVITLIQNVITLTILLVTFWLCLPSRSVERLKRDGIWVLVLGILLFITSPIQAVTSLLVIIAGALLMKAANEHTYSVTIEENDFM